MVNACVYKCLFKSFLNCVKSVITRSKEVNLLATCKGSLFQSQGAAFSKARWPKDFVDDPGTSRSSLHPCLRNVGAALGYTAAGAHGCIGLHELSRHG